MNTRDKVKEGIEKGLCNELIAKEYNINLNTVQYYSRLINKDKNDVNRKLREDVIEFINNSNEYKVSEVMRKFNIAKYKAYSCFKKSNKFDTHSERKQLERNKVNKLIKELKENEKLSNIEIAKRLNCSSSHVSIVLKRLGCSVRTGFKNSERLEAIKNMVENSHESIPVQAEKLGITPQTLNYYINRYELKVKRYELDKVLAEFLSSNTSKDIGKIEKELKGSNRKKGSRYINMIPRKMRNKVNTVDV